ncbi:nickel-responsive transcriptional regulator NikR [Candidatus Bathyarchaeota archaeon]|nr:nickel-responsive transcriptional regulator NikR [Candidatus Bathyarchaeota archaeon]
MTSGVSRISVSIDPDLLTEFDELVKRIGYNRSSAVQLAMRGFLTEHKWKDLEGVLAGVITMIYDHHTGGIMEELTHLQHDYTDIISSSTHIHLDHHNCLEILAVKGKASQIKKLANSLEVTRGLKQIRVSMMQ